MGQSTWGVAPARAPRSVFVMPPVIKSKEAKAAAAAASGKGKKKKWSKGKVKEKVNNLVLFDKNTFEKLLAEVPKYKMITPSILSDRLRINGALAQGHLGAHGEGPDPPGVGAQQAGHLHARYQCRVSFRAHLTTRVFCV